MLYSFAYELHTEVACQAIRKPGFLVLFVRSLVPLQVRILLCKIWDMNTEGKDNAVHKQQVMKLKPAGSLSSPHCVDHRLGKVQRQI